MATKHTIDVFTSLDLSDAIAQWKRISQRTAKPTGGRQEDFLPIEVLLCHAAMQLVEHRRYGSTTAHTAPTPVPELAALFRRPPSSILAKMANLDGSRSHGGKLDLAAASAWEEDPWRAEALYCIVLTAARRSGIGPAQLPDFLEGAEGH